MFRHARRAKELAAQLRGIANTAVAEQRWQDARGYTHFQRSGGYGQLLQGRGRYVLAGALGLGAVSYASSLQEIPFTHRRHSVWVTVDMEQALGKAAFEEMKQEAYMAGALLPQNHPYTRRVRRIGLAIVQEALRGKGGGYMQHMEGLDWEFIVIRRPDPNAMVVPGGKVIVHSGLLDIMQTDDEIGAVLGHEVAHVLARHVAEKLSQAQLFELLRTLLFWFAGIPVPSGAVALAVFLPNSRKLETEADMIGMQIAAASCFDPAAAIPVFQKLGAIEERSAAARIPGFLRTHPLTEARVKRVREEVPAARQVYEAAGCYSRRRLLTTGFW